MRLRTTIPDSDWKDGFLFVGNHLALDFLNTRPVQNGEPMCAPQPVGVNSSKDSEDFMKKMIGKVMAMCLVAVSLAAFAQSGDNMKQDSMKHDDMKQDQMNNDQMKKDEMKKDRKSKKTKKDNMKKDDMKKDDNMKHDDGMKQN